MSEGRETLLPADRWEDLFKRAEMRWMSAEDSQITVSSRDLAKIGRSLGELQEALCDCIDITLGHCRPANEWERLKMIRVSCERALGIDE